MKNLFANLRVYLRINNHCEDHGVNKELEQLIGTHPWVSYNYAKYVINGRFEFGEEVIYSDEDTKQGYQKFLETL